MNVLKFSKDAFNNLKISATRFPLSVFFAFLFFLLCLNGIYEWHLLPENKEFRVSAIIVAGFFWFGAAKLVAESWSKPIGTYLLASISVFALIAIYIYYGKYGSSVHNFILAGLVVFTTVAAFLRKDANDNSFYNFNREVLAGFSYSALLSMLFCAGLSVIIFTLEQLFGFKFSDKIYGVIWAFGSGFLAPYYALAWVPTNFSSKQQAHLPKGSNFILSYVLVPFGVIYFCILYAYAIKILIHWQLPKGILSYMICGFGAAGTFIQLASYPLREKGNWLVKMFFKNFCRVFLPLIFLLFLAISVRVNQYGLTESRYAIILAGVWFAATTLLYMIRKDDKTMKFGPAILAALLLLASFGPWGAVKLSEKSQVSRLESLLVKNAILQNGKVTKTTKDVSLDDKIAITSITNYLSKTEKLDAIKPWFAKDALNWADVSKYNGDVVTKAFGIDPSYEYNRGDRNSEYFNYYSERGRKPIITTGYDYYFESLYATGNYYEFAQYSGFGTKLEQNSLVLKFDNNEKFIFNLKPLVDELKTIALADRANIMVVEAENKKIKVQILFSNISGKFEPEPKINSAGFNLLVKLK
jgi:hypothetical protein